MGHTTHAPTTHNDFLQQVFWISAEERGLFLQCKSNHRLVRFLDFLRNLFLQVYMNIAVVQEESHEGVRMFNEKPFSY